MISVILPIYNVEPYIKGCIRSLLAQTYRDFEIVLVDDGSPDNSMKIAEQLLLGQPIPFRCIRTENRGVSAARNTGFEAAAGEYVIAVDADDVLSIDFLQDFADLAATHPDSNIYSCGFRVVKDEAEYNQNSGTDNRVTALSYEDAQRSFMSRRVPFLLPALMLKRSFLQENRIRFDELVRYSEDVQFIWRCLAHNRLPVCHRYKPNYGYILHPHSTMTASGVEKVLTGCGGVDRLYTEISPLLCRELRPTFTARWYFAMFHGVAKHLSYTVFKELYLRTGGTTVIRKLADDPDRKVSVVSRCLLLWRWLGYVLMRTF